MKSVKEGAFCKPCLAKGSGTEPMRKTWVFFSSGEENAKSNPIK